MNIRRTYQITIKLLPLLLLLTLLAHSCIWNNGLVMGEFPESPINLTEFNTQFDDYNSTAPSLGETFPFCFSSNRNNQGDNFDIIYMLMTIDFDKRDKELDIFNNRDSSKDVVIVNNNVANAMTQINTSSNEYGPYLIPQGLVIVEPQTSNRYQSYFMLYSSEEGGNQNIKFTHNLDSENYIDPVDVDFLNTEFDDSYPSINANSSELYFASNREGDFDIYSLDIDPSKELKEVLTNINSEPIKEKTLSSNFDDTCPFVVDDVMIFASNRDGGYGGYDLYYSRLENELWSTPINFGESVNSEFDEFRPIVRKELDFVNDIMIFSSNRTGGLGGFDLYYVGIDQLRE